MLPLKDNIPTDRVPLATLLLIAAGIATQLLADGGGLLVGLASALFLWLFGVPVEDATSRPRFVAFALLGTAAAVAVGRALDADVAVAVLAATGAASSALGACLRLYPRAQIVTLLLVPTSFTLHEVPAWAYLGAWGAIQGALALTTAGGGAILPATLAALALGALAVPLLGPRRKQLPASSIPALS